MSYFTNTVTKTYDYDDDKVTVTFKRMKRKDVLATLLGEGTPVEKQERVLAYLPDCITQFDGLKVNGEPITLAQAIEEQYFQPLIADITRDIYEASKLGDDDQKKSAERQPGISSE